MGAFFIDFHFPKGTPNPEQIRLRCCERTGLDIGLEIYDEQENEIECVLKSSEFEKPCILYIEERLVDLDLFNHSYFHWNVVLTLIDLGGLIHKEIKVLEIVFLPWKERKWWWSWQFMFGGPKRTVRAIYDDKDSK